MFALSPEMQQHLPSESIAVLQFIALKLPNSTSVSCIMRPEKYTSALPPNSTDPNEISILPLPPADVIRNLQQFVQHPTQSVICPHVMTAGGKRFPISTIPFWACILELQEVQTVWKLAVDSLQKRMDKEQGNEVIQKVFDALSHLLWSG